MKKPIIKIIVQFIFLELLFLFVVKLSLIYLPHQEVDNVYYAHINLYYLLACFSFFNYLNSKLNRLIILLFFIGPAYLSVSTMSAFFIWPNYQIEPSYYLYYKLNYVIINSILLLTSVYLLLYIKYPYKNLKFHLFYAILVTAVLIMAIYYSFFWINDPYAYSYDEISGANNKVFFLSFSILLLFWYEYSKQKHCLSEYISNIIVIFTIITGMEIMHIFLIKSEIDIFGDFYYLGQYFTSIFDFLMLIVWILRLNYLKSPQSQENEHFIKNYNKLYGFLNKPRIGLFEDFYHTINPKVVWAIILLTCILGISLLVVNHFNFFVKKNLILIIFAFIISIIFTMIYLNKRWYQSIDFLIKKKKK